MAMHLRNSSFTFIILVIICSVAHVLVCVVVYCIATSLVNYPVLYVAVGRVLCPDSQVLWVQLSHL